MKSLLNAFGFQLGWFICVMLQDWRALVYTVLYLLIHLYYIGRFPEIKFIISATLLGTLVDSVLMWAGIFEFGSNQIIIPLWLIALWMLFASTVHHALSWLGKYPVLAIVFGAAGGCASYYAGHKIGAVSFVMPLYITLPTIALVWAILFPTLQRIANVMDQAKS